MTPDQINRLLKSTLMATRSELRRPENLKKLYRFGDQVLPNLLTGVVQSGSERLIGELEGGRSQALRDITQVIYARMLPGLKPDYTLAQKSVDVVFATLFTPATLREILIEGLSDDNTKRLEHYLYNETTGLQSLLVRFVDVQKYLTQVRVYLLDHPTRAEGKILSFLDDLEVRERLAEKLEQYDWGNLTPDTKEAIAQFIDRCLIDTLLDHGTELTAVVTSWSPDVSRMITRFLVENDWLGWAIEQYIDVPDKPLATWLHQVLPGDVMAFLYEAALERERKNLLWRWLAPLLAGIVGIAIGLLIAH